MSTTEAGRAADEIDLRLRPSVVVRHVGAHERHTAVDVAASAPVDGEAGRSDEALTLRRRRRLIVAVIVGMLALIPLDFLLGQVIHDQRQRHLAYDVTQPIRRAGAGDALLVLQIPKIGVNEVVVEGAGASQLRGGPGHLEGSPIPGETGNSVIAGHRTRYSGPFGRLHELKKGDRIAVKTRRSTIVAYTVESVRTVPADSAAPIRASKDARVTLVTAAGGVLPDEHVVVTATPVKGQAAPVRATGLVGARRALSQDDLDQRPTSPLVGVLLAIVLLAVAMLAIFVTGRDLRRRYSPLVAAAVITPVVALLVVLSLFLADVALPTLL